MTEQYPTDPQAQRQWTEDSIAAWAAARAASDAAWDAARASQEVKFREMVA
jgi:hypothetical protein